MENMNNWYNFICTSEGYEVRSKNNNELMGFYDIHEGEGFILKNYVDFVQYKTAKGWIKGLRTYRDIDVNFEYFK